MILYPIIILVSLVIAFAIFWRKAYLLEKDGIVDLSLKQDQAEIAEHSGGLAILKEKIHLPTFHRKSEVEPEASVEEETDTNVLKADDLFRKKQYISAEKWYLEAVRNNPKNPKIYSRLGIIYLEQKNFKDAADSLEEAIRLDPSSASRFFNLSFAYNSLGDKKQAIANAKRSIRLEPASKKYRKWMDRLKIRSF